MAEKLVYYDIADKIAVVTLDHPPMNALDVPTKLDLLKVFEALDERRDEVRAVIMRGAGEKAFVAGADIKSFLELTPETARRRLMLTHRIYAAVENYQWPVIAAIHGFCLGGGLELAMCCDIRYAEEDSQFGFPEVNLSIFPGNGGTGRGLHFLTIGRFKELVYSGRRIGAQEALEYGLIEKVTPKDASYEAALELAAQIADRGPLGVAAAKRVINRVRNLPLSECLELEADYWSALAASEDMKEGATAFMEKRKPVYRCC